MIDDTVIFRRRLEETIAWCVRHAEVNNPKSSLRTPTLRPGNVVEETNDYHTYQWSEEAVVNQTISTLSAKRDELLKEDSTFPIVFLSKSSGGKLLVTEPDQSLDDGLSEDKSEGFFDTSDVPPWDTWLWFFGVLPTSEQNTAHSLLISWVPEEFLTLVEKAVAVNSTACICWAEAQVDKYSFLGQLSKNGLLI